MKMEESEVRFVIKSVSQFADSLTNEELIEVIYWIQTGWLLGLSRPKCGEKLFTTIIGEDVLNLYKDFFNQKATYNDISIHISFINVVKMHLLNISFDRYKSLVEDIADRVHQQEY